MEFPSRLLIYTLWMLVFPELFTVFHEGEAAHAVKRFTGLYTGPYFDPTTTTNITTQLGTHAYIPCKIKQLGNKSVSWIRRRDAHILTVDRYTFIADERFQAFFVEATDTWTLQVKYVQARDAGQYECQVSTEPKMSHFITLNVVVPKIEIEGESDIYVKRGSTVQLKCVITQSLEEPAYIFWYHDGERVLKYDQSAIDIRMSRKGTDTTISTITIFRTKPEDAGNYTCNPSNLDSASVYLHVLNGKLGYDGRYLLKKIFSWIEFQYLQHFINVMVFLVIVIVIPVCVINISDFQVIQKIPRLNFSGNFTNALMILKNNKLVFYMFVSQALRIMFIYSCHYGIILQFFRSSSQSIQLICREKNKIFQI